MSALEFTEAELTERAAKVLGRPRLPAESDAKPPPYLGPSEFAKNLAAIGAASATRAILDANGIRFVDALYGRDRHLCVSMARHELQAWLKRNVRMSFPEIGRLFGRDHTTILSACQKIDELARESEPIARRQQIPRDLSD